MVKKLTIDSSVIISSLLEDEPMHKEASAIMEEVLKGKAFAIMPFTILVEVVSAVRRRTGIEDLAVQVMNELTSIENLSRLPLFKKRLWNFLSSLKFYREIVISATFCLF